MRVISFILALSIFVCGTAGGAAPLKGGVEETGAAGATESSVLDQLRQQLQELKALNARLDAAAKGGASASRTLFPAKVSAADERFRPHKLFAEAELPKEATEEGWYRIPEWRAGKYLREKQTDHTITGDVTIKSRVEHVYGMQQDRSGGIWHHRSWPHITKVDMDGYTEYKIIEKYEPIEGAPNEFAFKVSSTDIDVDNKTNRIKRVTKQLEVDRYTPGPNGTAIGECEWQGYTADGNPNTQVEHSSVEEMQMEPFRVVNFWRNKDLRASFHQYLRSHDMADLIPEE
jgi:hypothetical protein